MDEIFVNSIKALIQDSDQRKQWVGFLLISKIFDPKMCEVDEQVFNKTINVFLQSISTVISKNDLLSDISIVAISAWQAITSMLGHLYDSRQHQGALLVMKSICQNVIRKLEKAEGKDVHVKIVLGALLKCIQVFPSSFKQIVGSNRGGEKKKDSVTQIFEEMAKRYIDTNP